MNDHYERESDRLEREAALDRAQRGDPLRQPKNLVSRRLACGCAKRNYAPYDERCLDHILVTPNIWEEWFA